MYIELMNMIIYQWHIQKDFHTPVYRHGHPNSGVKNMKYTFIYTVILHRRLFFLLLNLSKIYF